MLIFSLYSIVLNPIAITVTFTWNKIRLTVKTTLDNIIHTFFAEKLSEGVTIALQKKNVVQFNLKKNDSVRV